jgi:hypothetical protein
LGKREEVLRVGAMFFESFSSAWKKMDTSRIKRPFQA